MTFDEFATTITVEFDFAGSVTRMTRLERDMELDSIGKYELLLVIEELIGRELPDEVLFDVLTAGDLYERCLAV